ncbi:MAG: endolytic transglycosylase MltG [Saprospiraceae bacterium]
MNKSKHFVRNLLIIGLLISAIFASVGYYFLYAPNTSLSENKSIFIPTGSSFQDVEKLLVSENIIKTASTFRTVAGIMRYKQDNVPSGKYNFKTGMSNKAIISKLRSGNQDPVDLVINNVRYISDLAGKVSKYLEVDSMTILNYFNDPGTYSKFGYTKDDFLSMFIPNTYKLFWTASPEDFVERMSKEHKKYWTPEKIASIEKNNLTTTSAFILASIVEKESNYNAEKPRIAGVYLNRLKQNIKLQADPTVVYAMGDFTIMRVLHSHLFYESPFNTYLNYGLPPGPICMPSLQSLEAVINAENHEYVYFCAKADNSGAHSFAVSYGEHLKNADAFARWLNEKNIK